MIKGRKIKLILNILIFITTLLPINCGTLGNIGSIIYFPTSKARLEIAIDSLFSQYPEYRIPENWRVYDNWSKSYAFIESRIFYFKHSPEEMYYVTFIGDSTKLTDTSEVGISIRAVLSDTSRPIWHVGNELDKKEKQRMKLRFYNDIITKLEQYTHTKVWYESAY